MAQFTPGFTFHDGDKVHPADLNNLIDQASLTGLGATNFAGTGAGLIFYGNTAPPLQRGALWYDTTVGSEGLKVAYISASNGSFARWLYMTPRREGVFWTVSSCSLGFPMFLNRSGFAISGHQWNQFDGCKFDRIFLYDAASGPNGAMVIPTESASASSPVVCAWAGLVRCTFGNNPLAAKDPVFTNYQTPGTFTAGGVAASAHVWGVQLEAFSQAGQPANPTAILHGAGPAIEDFIV